MRKVLLIICLLVGMLMVQGCADEDVAEKQAQENFQQFKDQLIKDQLNQKLENELEDQKLEIELEDERVRIQQRIKKERLQEAERIQEMHRLTKESNAAISRSAPITILSGTISQEYEANEIRADQKYGGRIIRVQGKVTSIGVRTFGGYYVVLEGRDWLSGVHCSFPKDRTYSVANLNKGQMVTIKGKVGSGGTTMGSVTLDNCNVE